MSCRHNIWPQFNPLVVPTSPVYIHVLCWVTQLCLTLCDPMDCSLPGSSVHGDSPSKDTGVGCQTLLQGIFQPRDQTQFSWNASRFFINWATREAHLYTHTHTHTHTHTYIYMYVYGSYIQAHIHTYIYTYIGFPGGARVVKNLSANARDTGLIPGSGRSSGEGNVNPLQYSCLENSMDRGAWKSIVHRVSKSWTLSDKHWVYTFYVMNSSTEY